MNKFLKPIIASALIGMFSVSSSVFAEDTLRIVSWGGPYQKGQSIGIFQPAAKAMGITVKEDTYGGISDVKLMVKSGADKFDIFSSGAGSCASGAAEGLLEKLDLTVIDEFITLSPDYVTPDNPLAYALNKMHIGGYRNVPVVNDELYPIGVIGISDIIATIAEYFHSEIINLPSLDKIVDKSTQEGG